MKMVDKKVVAGVVALAAVGAAALALKGAEAPPVEEGAPEGEVTIEVTPQGRSLVPMGDVSLKVKIQGRTLDDVKGVWGVGATINVNGLCTAGFPIPSMVLELYDNGVIRKTTTVPSVVLGTTYNLSETMGSADIGDHAVYGRMVLSNELGSYEFTTDTQSFSIGEEPPGEVTIEVTLV